MDYNRLLELFWEFASKIESWHTLYLDSIAGYDILHKTILTKQENKKKLFGEHEYTEIKFQDTCSVDYKYLCGKDFIPISMSPLMKQGDMKKRVHENGENYLLLGNLCLVSAYSYWEEYLRIEIGIAIGALKKGSKNSEETRRILNKHVKSDFWGDVKHLRHSILHNNGIANSDVSKCKIFKWFKPGQKIKLDYKKMRAIFLLMGQYRNELHKMSLPPQEGLKIPVQ